MCWSRGRAQLFWRLQRILPGKVVVLDRRRAGMTDQLEASRETVLIDLALQGGGSHGAFTWGVLDRLLEEPWLKIDAISGTSAGAMNAAVLVSGYIHGGAQGARKALDVY